jgi:opacity protein-like surface antigen
MFVMRKSQKLLAGLASLTLFDIAVAAAADLPVKARPPAPVATYNWSGFYIGGHAGYRWADANFSAPGYDFDDPVFGIISFSPRNESYRPSGGIIGVQAGYNFMVTPTILAGLEGDWTWGSSSESSTVDLHSINLTVLLSAVRFSSRGRRRSVAAPVSSMDHGCSMERVAQLLLVYVGVTIRRYSILARQLQLHRRMSEKH